MNTISQRTSLGHHLQASRPTTTSTTTSTTASTTAATTASTAPTLHLLFLHGQLNDSTSVDAIGHRLSARFPGRPWAALDLPWHGQSPGPSDGTPATLGKSVLAALSSLGWRDAIVVGHSLGGWACLDAMLEDPDGPIAHGIVVGCPHDLSDEARTEFRALAAVLERDGITDDLVAIALQRWYGHRSGEVPESRRADVRDRLHANDLAAAAAVFRHTADRPRTQTKLPHLLGKLSVILGSEDVIVSDAEADTMAMLTGTHVHKIPGAGHFPFDDAPDVFDDVLAGIVQQIDDNR